MQSQDGRNRDKTNEIYIEGLPLRDVLAELPGLEYMCWENVGARNIPVYS